MAPTIDTGKGHRETGGPFRLRQSASIDSLACNPPGFRITQSFLQECPMIRRSVILIPLAAAMLSGCIASTALKVVTAPVRVAGKTVDVMTTSQSEADENRGRAIRKQDKKLDKLERQYDRQLESCRRGQSSACSDAQGTYVEMAQLRSRR
jgi:hypothetical protein